MTGSGPLPADSAPGRPGEIRARGKGFVRRGACLGFWLPLIVSSLLLFWVGLSFRPVGQDTRHIWYQRHYEYLTEGFVHGNLSLSVAPAPELLKLKDPYDPRQNEPYRLWDASLYDGRYFLYFGPTPSLLFMLPFRILTGTEPSQGLTIAVFAAVGCAALGLLLWDVRDRHFPTVSAGALAFIAVVAMHAAWLPVTLRWPGVWQLPIVAAVACLWWSLYFLWRWHESGGRLRWAFAAGLGLAFLVGSRPAFLPAAVVIAALVAAPAAVSAAAPRRRWRGALAAGAMVALGGGAFLLYNHARFGQFLEFGQRYQLWGSDERGIRHFSLAYAPFNAWLYVFSVSRLTPYFPFVLGVAPGDLPTGYIAVQEMHGLLFALPIQLAGLAGLAWIWPRRREPDALALSRVVAGAAIASVFAAGILFCYAGACSRYITELLAGWTVLTCVGLMALFAQAARPFPIAPPARPAQAAPPARAALAVRRWVKALAILAALWTIAYAWLASARFQRYLKMTEPRLYAFAAHTFDYPSAWYAKALGHPFGPATLMIHLEPFKGPETVTLLASTSGTLVNTLSLARLDPRRVRLVFFENDRIKMETPPIAAKDTLQATVEAPWLYPPASHPFWDRFPDKNSRSARQTTYSATVGGTITTGFTDIPFEPESIEPVVAGPGDEPLASAWVEAFGHAGR